MIDISGKKTVPREAEARGTIKLKRRTIEAIRKGEIKKGDVLAVAEVTAMQGVKKTPDTLPHCHPIPIDGIDTDIQLTDDKLTVGIRVKANYRTGVEMEALSGVTTALLTVWDMVKYMEKDSEGQYPDTVITDIRVVEKLKGD